ncbi:MAG: hypothetical protein LZF61_05890 [Nitrosomonas sp.]|nr:MAG: hypothetical protein LZF61_05890 [Nitrosomonas sp.]
MSNEQKEMIELLKDLTLSITKLTFALNEARADIAAHKAIINTLLKHQHNLDDITDDFSNSISIASYQTRDQDDMILEKCRAMLEMMKQNISGR